MEGWIKIHRKILENPIICKDSDYLAVWIYLLLNATHREIPALFKGKKIILQKGQLITGRKSMANQLKISESKIYRIINDFKSEHQIEQQTSNKNSVITILNWNKYQQIEQQNEQQMNNKRTTDEQQVNTNKNVKNVKNERITAVGDSCVDGLQEIIDFYNNNIGAITPYGTDILADYLQEMPKELIILAMKKSVEANIRTIQYIKGILNNWKKKGINTLVEAEQENNNKKSFNQENAKKGYQNYEQRDIKNFDNFYAN